MRRILDTLVLVLAVLTASASTAAEAADAGQVVAIRTGDDTTARLVHADGDPVALLVVTLGPDGLEQVLRQQVGPWCPRIERRERRDDTETFALYLRDARVRATSSWVHRPRTLRIVFADRARLPQPAPARVIGHVAGLGVSGASGPALPPLPSRSPCDAAPSSARCGWFDQAKLAAAALDAGQGLEAHERWAYRFTLEDEWPRDLPAYGYAALTAAQVLVARNLLPEAEVLLTSKTSLRTGTIAPYTALVLADAYERSDRPDDAKEILDKLIEDAGDPTIRSRALLASLRASVEARRFYDAAARIETLPERTEGRGDGLAHAWMLAGETAIASGDTEAAYARFSRALDEAESPVLTAEIHLRLGDIALGPAGSRARARRHWNRAARGPECTKARVDLRRLLLSGPKKKKVDLADRLDLTVREGACFATRVEALYALAYVHSVRGDDAKAIDTLRRTRELGAAGLGGAWGVETAVLASIEELASIWVERMKRADDAPAIVEATAGALRPYLGLVSAPTLIRISEAHRRLGVDLGLADRLVAHLRSGPSPELERRLLVELAEVYLSLGDDFRAEVTTRYFVKNHLGAADSWRGRLLTARLALAKNEPDIAHVHLVAVEDRTPEGDARQALRELRVRALFGMNDVEQAVSVLLQWLDGSPTPGVQARSLVVDVASRCVRDCSTETLERLLIRLGTFEGGAVVSERMRILAKQRGVSVRAGGEGGVWNRYERALAETKEDRF